MLRFIVTSRRRVRPPYKAIAFWLYRFESFSFDFQVILKYIFDILDRMNCLNFSQQSISVKSLIFFLALHLILDNFSVSFQTCSDINLTNAVNRGKNQLSVVLILHATEFSALTGCFLLLLSVWESGFMDTPIHLKGSDLPPKIEKECKAGFYTQIFSAGHKILRNHRTRWLISKYSAAGSAPGAFSTIHSCFRKVLSFYRSCVDGFL